jgi:hypothetical protein
MQVQVVYNQGLVKLFIAPQEILLADFVNTARAFGRIKVMRFMTNVDSSAAKLIVSTGNAVMVEAKRGVAHG